jgi:hypothetical protein
MKLRIEVVNYPHFDTTIAIITGTAAFAGECFFIRAKRCVIRHASQVVATWWDTLPAWRRVDDVGGGCLEIIVDSEAAIVSCGGVISGDVLAPTMAPWFPTSSGFTLGTFY